MTGMTGSVPSQEARSDRRSLPGRPAPAPRSSSPAPAGNAFTWTAGATCRRTARTDRTRRTAVRHGSASEAERKQEKCGYLLPSSPPVDCITSPWTAWSACSASCGLGSLFRQRDVLREALPGGACGGARFDSRSCFPRACPGPKSTHHMHLPARFNRSIPLSSSSDFCSRRSVVRVDGVVGVRRSVRRRRQTEGPVLFRPSS